MVTRKYFKLPWRRCKIKWSPLFLKEFWNPLTTWPRKITPRFYSDLLSEIEITYRSGDRGCQIDVKRRKEYLAISQILERRKRSIEKKRNIIILQLRHLIARGSKLRLLLEVILRVMLNTFRYEWIFACQQTTTKEDYSGYLVSVLGESHLI